MHTTTFEWCRQPNTVHIHNNMRRTAAKVACSEELAIAATERTERRLKAPTKAGSSADLFPVKDLLARRRVLHAEKAGVRVQRASCGRLNAGVTSEPSFAVAALIGPDGVMQVPRWCVSAWLSVDRPEAVPQELD